MYKDNQLVIEFMGKAQKKIAELASFVVEKEFDNPEYSLLKDLCLFIECLDSEFMGWTLEETLYMIEYFNQRAELNTMPFFHLVGYNTTIVTGNNSGSEGAPVDYVSLINAQIKNTPHNNLKDIQGGKINEYYHLSKDAYDKLMLLLYPFVEPTVSLNITSTIPASTNGVYEKGTSISQVSLAGSVVINGGVTVLNTKYYKAGALLVTNTGGSLLAPYTVTTPITTTTEFKYTGEFEKGGIKEAKKSVVFESPYYTAVGKRGLPLTSLVKSKVLRTKPTQIDVPFTAPVGNATSLDPVTFYVCIPKYWGAFTKIEVDNNSMFPYLNTWKRTEFNVTLPDGSLEPYYMYEFTEATQGTFNFNFKWQ